MIIHLFLLLHDQFQIVYCCKVGGRPGLRPCPFLSCSCWGALPAVIAPAKWTDEHRRRCFLLKKTQLEKTHGSLAFWHMILAKNWQRWKNAALKGLHKRDTKFQLQSAFSWKHPCTITTQRRASSPHLPLLITLASFLLFPHLEIFSHVLPTWWYFTSSVLKRTRHTCGAVILTACFQSVPPKREVLT